MLGAMLSRFNRINRVRATIAVVVAYASCVLAPHAALALTGGNAALHCLAELSSAAHVHAKPAAAVEHVHADGNKHVHHNAAPVKSAQHTHGEGTTHNHSKNSNGSCCGLFCITALNHDGVAALPAPPPEASKLASLETARTSHNPDRIDEPPIG